MHKKFLTSFVCLMLTAISIYPALANLTPHRLRLAVSPHPQEIFNSQQAPGAFRIDAATTIRVLHDEDLAGAKLIASDVQRRAGLTLSVTKEEKPQAAETNVIYVSRATDNVTLQFPDDLIKQVEVTEREGYSLLIANNRILIRAADARGAVYGVQTLRQMIRGDGTIPSLLIRDWPEMPQRMVYGNFNGDFQSKAAIDGYVDRALLLKYNAIVFESIWSAGQNWWFHHAGERQELAKYFAEACKKYHIEFIPLIQGPGWGYGIVDQAPMLTSGKWIQKEKQKLQTATPTPLAQRNVVTNSSAPIVVTDVTGKIEYEKDKDFKVLPGKTVRPYQPQNAPWQLQAIEGGAIVDGQEVLVSYNAVVKSTPHQAWNVSDPESFRLLNRTLDTVQASIKPSTIHIGHDEIWQIGEDSRDIQSGLTPEQLLHRELMHWYNRIKKNNPDAKILMWDDLLRPGRSGVSYGMLTESAEDIPKDIVVVPWYYYATETSAATIKNRVEHLTKSGFSVIGAPSGYFRENSYLWYQALQPYLKDGRAKGMMFTVWDLLHRGDMVAAGELMWSGQTVNRELFRALNSVTDRMKGHGLVFTLSPKLQLPAFAQVVDKGLKENKTPEKISADFTSLGIRNTSIFVQALGSQAWSTLAKDAFFPEQEIANVQRVPLFVEAMAKYVRAEATKDQTLLDEVIYSLHELNHISFKQRNDFLEKSQKEWIGSLELFGVELPKLQ